jgi:hypothetical protein
LPTDTHTLQPGNNVHQEQDYDETRQRNMDINDHIVKSVRETNQSLHREVSKKHPRSAKWRLLEDRQA